MSKIQIDKLGLDKLKEEHLSKNGWHILRFFESDINENVENCVNQIEKKINKIAFEKAGDIWEK
ncbi:DUF559 domain-containing protein [Candidatus Woesearchaeota archaeon]|nr:DUF559 domain-containing protein [Candidatus Woesearchaeota archaeon]